jgi:methyl-accepting chemotaxis protein
MSNKSLKSFGIAHRVLALIALMAVSMIALAGIRLVDLRTTLVEQKQNELRQLVESAVAVADSYYKRAQAGEMTEQDAQAAALAAIGAMRYNAVEYFWVNDMQPVMIMHPIKPELNGKDLSTFKDPSGFELFNAFVKTVRSQQSGFVSYLWPKANEELPIPKESYVQGFAPWGWIIGTGVYIDDLDAIFWKEAISEGGTIAIILFAIGAVSLFVAGSITRPIKGMSRSMRSLADGNLEADIPGVGRRDEIGEMADTVQVFRANAIEQKRLEEENRKAAQRAEQEKRQAMKKVADDFEASVRSVVETVSATAGQMQSTAKSMTAAAGETENQASSAASASEEASTNVQTVAAATEEGSGQFHIEFDVAELAARVAPLAHGAAERARARLDEHTAAEWFDLGVELEAVAPDEARDAYEQALRIDPQLADPRVNLGRLLHEAGLSAEAEVQYRQVLSVREHSLAAYNLGVLLEDMKRGTDAIQAYARAIAADPELAEAHFNLARLYEQRGDQRAAIRHFNGYRALVRPK